jgi:hypothetical protein
MANLIPDQLHLKSADETQTIDINIPGGGEQKIQTTGSLKVQCANSLTLRSYDAKMQVGGNVSFANADSSQQYYLPNPNTSFPNLNDTILFNFDGTARFGSPGGGGNFSTPSSVALDMNTHAINNITDLNLVSPTDPGSIGSLNVRDNQTTLSTNKPLQISCAGADMELVANNIRCRTNNGGIFAIFNDSGYYVLPQTVPTVDNSVAVFGSNGFSTFQQLPVVPAGATPVYSPLQENILGNQKSLSNIKTLSLQEPVQAGQDPRTLDVEIVGGNVNFTSGLGVNTFNFDKDISTDSYSVNTIGSDVATLQSQVSSLISIIYNLTGIQV